MDIIQKLTDELEVRKQQVEAAVKLIDEGNTIPFISRYRKEATGALDDEQLRKLDERLRYLRNLEEKKAQVLSSIEEQGKLTEELRAEIEAAETQVAVDDLYRPYRPKRRTRATMAKEKGLEGLADIIRLQMTERSLEEEAAAYLSEEKGVHTAEEAIAGAKDIIAEAVSDQAEYRTHIREQIWKAGLITSEAKDEGQESVYETYYHFSQPVNKMAGHRTLALNRGEAEKMLTVKIEEPEEEILTWLCSQVITWSNVHTEQALKEAVEDSYARLIRPAIEREIRGILTEQAEEGAIQVFGKNLEQLLMQPPIAGHTVLGWDPGYRNGCKLAVVDATGKVLDSLVIYPTAPRKQVQESKRILKNLIAKYGITLISLGNGTASRESEQIIAELLKEIPQKVQYVIVSEAGASSIARRLQDPLAEMVKIDPKSIGVGQYQYDMDQKRLGEALSGVVEDVVNRVGVDLNTASAPLLSYISGITKSLAKNIVAWREENGRFTSRRQLLKVPKLGPKAYEQCAGFLRIMGGTEPLDATGVHPESYEAAKKLLASLGYSTEDLSHGGIKGISRKVRNLKKTAEDLSVGELTLQDILKELEKPARDPREEMPRPVLRSDVLDMEDLKPGMTLKGTVRNIIDFGAFVDIGVHQDGLVHISQMSDRYIKHPLEVVKIGDVVDVKVLSVDTAKKRISLTMKL